MDGSSVPCPCQILELATDGGRAYNLSEYCQKWRTLLERDGQNEVTTRRSRREPLAVQMVFRTQLGMLVDLAK
jgi:hypothetical protein